MQALGRRLTVYRVWRRDSEDVDGDVQERWVRGLQCRAVIYPETSAASDGPSGTVPTARYVGYTHSRTLRVGDCLGDEDGPRFRIVSLARTYIGDTTLQMEDMESEDVA